jgi:Skp family chaperone for outer membrane proteins
MFHRNFVIAVFAAVLMLVPVSAKAADLSIAVVDVEKILAESKAAQSLQTQLQAKKESFQKEFSEKEKQLKSAENTLISEKEKLSAEEFAKKRKSYEEKVIQTRKEFQKSRASLDAGLSKAMLELRKSIVEAAAKVANDKSYDVVLTRESVLIAEKALDITDDVLKAINEKVTNIPLKLE